MGNIFTDIVEDVQVRPNYSKIVLTWVVRIAVILIGAAFTYGQVKSVRLNKIGDMENSLIENTRAVIDMRQEMKNGFDNLNLRVDKVYDDGFKSFNDFQIYNKKQLEMIIDYGKSDKEMLKRMLDITSMEETKSIENKIQQAKSTTAKDTFSIVVRPVKK
jgi:hypothetical protein